MKNSESKIYWPIGLSKDMPGRTTAGPSLEPLLEEYAHSLVSPGTTVKVGWMSKTTSLLSSNFLGMVNDAYVVRDILKAQDHGYNGVMIGPHWDPGLYAAREAASIPVSGPLESSIAIAQTLGRRFAVLTVHEGYVPMIERSIRVYGAESRAIARRPVRRFGMTFANAVSCLEGKDDEFLQEFTKCAKGCIEDGADVIIAGGQLFGPIFQKYNYVSIDKTGVPVVEVAACGLKMLETMITLKRTIGLNKSEHPNAPFRTPDKSLVDSALKEFFKD
jgi:allantoin racemase